MKHNDGLQIRSSQKINRLKRYNLIEIEIVCIDVRSYPPLHGDPLVLPLSHQGNLSITAPRCRVPVVFLLRKGPLIVRMD